MVKVDKAFIFLVILFSVATRYGHFYIYPYSIPDFTLSGIILFGMFVADVRFFVSLILAVVGVDFMLYSPTNEVCYGNSYLGLLATYFIVYYISKILSKHINFNIFKLNLIVILATVIFFIGSNITYYYFSTLNYPAIYSLGEYSLRVVKYFNGYLISTLLYTNIVFFIILRFTNRYTKQINNSKL